MISPDEALARIARFVRPISRVETLPAIGALGRVLAAPVRARADLPRFDNSAMDGYAVNTAALDGAGPWVLDVTERIAAGMEPLAAARPGTATRIFTGAPLPQGADAVVMQEEVQRQGDQAVLTVKPRPGAHVRKAGAELIAGQEVMAAGCRVGPHAMAGLAVAGHGSIQVRARLRVALMVTGDEVRQPGVELGAAQIWDVNTPMLSAALTRPDVALEVCAIAADDFAGTRQKLTDLAGQVDLLVTTGGISVGEEDHVKPALIDLGLQQVFSGVALKPGKPVSLGWLGNTWWLGLPGNPLSAFVTWQLFGTELLRALTGQTVSVVRRRSVRLDATITHGLGRTELRPARIAGIAADDREVVTFDGYLDSARIARLHLFDGLIVIPADTARLPQGALVEFQPFSQ